jgi:hypothetical protein
MMPHAEAGAVAGDRDPVLVDERARVAATHRGERQLEVLGPEAAGRRRAARR